MADNGRNDFAIHKSGLRRLYGRKSPCIGKRGAPFIFAFLLFRDHLVDLFGDRPKTPRHVGRPPPPLLSFSSLFRIFFVVFFLCFLVREKKKKKKKNIMVGKERKRRAAKAAEKPRPAF